MKTDKCKLIFADALKSFLIIIFMHNKTIYKVLFKGVILPGFDKEQVIENVHNTTRIPKEIIKRKFFSGKTVVIRRADNQDYASRLQKKFALAGIETYIEVIEQVTTDSEQDDFEQSARLSEMLDSESQSNQQIQSAVAPPADKPTTITKRRSYATAGTILIVTLAVILSAYFLYDTAIDTVNVQTEKNIGKDSPVTKTRVKNKQANTQKGIPGEPFLSIGQTNVLIKITDANELNRLSQLLPLVDLDSAYFDILKQEILLRDTGLTISVDKPLYLYKTSQHKGVIVHTVNQSSVSISEKFQKQFNFIYNRLQSNQLCADSQTLKLYSKNNLLLLTTLKNLENPLEEWDLIHSLVKFDKLFYQSKAKKAFNFNLYFSTTPFYATNKNTLNTDRKETDYLALSAQGSSLWLAPGKQFYNHSRDLLEALGIKTSKVIELSSIKIHNLSDLTFLLVGQTYSDKFSKQESSTSKESSTDKESSTSKESSTDEESSTNEETGFAQEQITPLNPDFSSSDIKAYQKDLDIEFQPQWQGGPFALSTNNYQFDHQLIIELLAKGQNVDNLMEYSHSAKLTTHAVYNKNKENILAQQIIVNKKPLANKEPSANKKCFNTPQPDSYFKDIDGEQEAYINDDFITYRAISAREQIRILPKFNLQDIAQIEGEISLQLPGNIIQNALKKPYRNHLSQLQDFTLLLNQQADNKTLVYQVVDPKNHFITLRAYNTSGEVLDTTSLKQLVIRKNHTNLYQQSFSEPVTAIKVFYTNQRESLSYPFTLKPEIIVASAPLSTEDSPPITFSSTRLDLKPLSEQSLSDNPPWLGKKIAEKAISPFHISLFIHDEMKKDSSDITHNASTKTNNVTKSTSSQKTYTDAVVNIKTSITPLFSENISSVKISLFENQKIILDNFVAFSEKGLSEHEDAVSNNLPGSFPETDNYLNANSAFQLKSNHQVSGVENILGTITLSLPTAFKTYSRKYLSPGQVIKLNSMIVKLVKVTRRQVQFEISGKIEDLVQLKLYNAQNELISEPFEFKHIQKDSARLTLLYNDEIETIKLVLAQFMIRKDYPFSFTEQLSENN
ncbi:MAG: hypothetical protein QNL62_02355 [Gammaproteobacteria bacterium]|nr:hypothetical protein [Gammaproteobacteria bacterium]